ncbi:MAG: oxidoreductase [Candidatus Omnitrophica bacterium]|nr:oxidoreductase [Candidatus Omnitrophota bacterium]
MIAKELKIKEVIQRTYNVKSVRLGVGQDVEYKAGQFMCVHLLAENECRRYLSISSSPTEKGYIEFTKKITESDFSRALDNLKAGDSLRVEYPMGNFTLKDPKEKIAFLSGGIGITPIRSIAKFVVDSNLGTDLVLLYANRAAKDVAFKEDFDLMQKGYPKLKVVHVLCEADPGFNCREGRIDAEIIKNEIADYQERRFYLCGPPAMVEAMKKILAQELKLAKDNIVTENFTGY